MSLIINKNNIYAISPNPKYADYSVSITNGLDNDFTIFVRGKAIVDELEVGNDGYIISKNGRHAGIGLFKTEENRIGVFFSFWFWKEGEENIHKRLAYLLDTDKENEFNDYTMICNHINSNIDCYVNGKSVGTIEYDGLTKYSYVDSFLWLGCGNLLSDNYNHYTSFEYDRIMLLNIPLYPNKIYDFLERYNDEYVESYYGLPILDVRSPYKDNIFLFLDFKDKTNFKLWNLAFNGNYPNLYIENHTSF